MASIKVQASVIILACKNYEKGYRVWKDCYAPDKDDECAWMEETVRKENLNRVLWLQRMAEFSNSTSYPYITINELEYQLIGEYIT